MECVDSCRWQYSINVLLKAFNASSLTSVAIQQATSTSLKAKARLSFSLFSESLLNLSDFIYSMKEKCYSSTAALKNLVRDCCDWWDLYRYTALSLPARTFGASLWGIRTSLLPFMTPSKASHWVLDQEGGSWKQNDQGVAVYRRILWKP